MLTVLMNDLAACRFDSASEFIQLRLWCIVWVCDKDLLLWCDGSANSAQAHKGQHNVWSHGSAIIKALYHCTDSDARASLALGNSR